MSSHEYQKIMQIVDVLMDCEPEELEARISEECSGDDSLRREVEKLLAQDKPESRFLEESPLNVFSSPQSDEEQSGFIGRRIGAYRIIDEIGRGGMGAVFRAVRDDDQYQTEVAIKLIKRGMDTESILRRFRNERQILADLNHPNVARLLDGGTTEDGLPYFVMEYIKGQSVDNYCAQNDLSITERLNLFRTVCSAVSHAHQNLVIHRDLKPSNILVTADGTTKLLDFGIAKVLQSDGEGAPAALTATELRVMTPDYASPEQVKGTAITTVSDVYSLGVVLYELLTGQRPYHFKSRNPDEVVRVICEQEAEKPSHAVSGRHSVASTTKQSPEELTTDKGQNTHPQDAIRDLKLLRGDLDNIILKALRKEPERRYSSVDQFSEDIRRYLERLPVIAHQDSFSYRGAKLIQRHKTAAIAGLLIACALIAGTIGTAWEAHVARAERAKADRRFNDVRKLANLFMFKYHDGIAALPGSTELRKHLVKDAIDYLNSLASEASNDRELLRELGTAYHRIGDIQGGIMTSASGGTLAAANLGDTAGALESYRKAFVIRQKVAELEPSNKEMRQELGTSISRMGEISLTLGKPDEAMDYLRQAAAIYETLSAADPSEKVLRLKLSSIYFTMGRIYGVPGGANLGDTQRALEYLRKSEAMDQALVAEDPTNAKYLQALAADYGNVGRVLSSNGDNQQALDCYRKALAIGETLARENPTNALYQRELSAQYLNVGNALLSLGDKSNALQNSKLALAIRRFLVTADPSDASIRRDLAVAHRSMGEAQAANNEIAQARENFDEATKILTDLAEKDSKNAVVSYQQSLTDLKFSIFLSNQGDTPGALRWALLAVAVDETLVAVNSKDANARQTLALSYFQIGKVHAAIASLTKIPSAKEAHWREARSWYQKSMDLWQAMRDQGTLRGADAGKIDEGQREIDCCDSALQMLPR